MRKSTAHDLSGYVPYLVRRLGPEIGKAHQQLLTEEDLTSDMFRCLWALYFDGPQSLNALSVRTAIHVSTLSRLIGRMETRKLVSRQRTGSSARSVEIGLLPQGLEKCKHLIPWSLKYQKHFLVGFTEKEVAQLKNFLKRLYDNLSETNRTRNLTGDSED